jgi:threonine aldolase
MGMPATNMIFTSLADSVELTAADVAQKLAAQNIKVGVVGPRRFRLVMHYWIDDDAVDKTLAAFKQALK